MSENNNEQDAQSLISINKPNFKAAPIATTNFDYPMHRFLQGRLSRNKRIKGQIPIIIDFDEGEYIVSEPKFHIHGSGMTQDKAIAAFARIISEIYDELVEESDHLSNRMKAQLEYLQSIIEVVK